MLKLSETQPAIERSKSIFTRQNDTLEKKIVSWQKTQDRAQAGEILRELDPYIQTSVNKYAGGSPVAVGKARGMTIKALQTYDPQKASPQTFIDRQLQGLKRWNQQYVGGVKLPSRMILERRRMLNTETEFEDEHGRPPNTAELADRLNIPIKKIQTLREMRFAVPESTEISNQDDEVTYLGDMSTKSYQDKWVELVYHDLDDRDKIILEHTVGLYGKRPMSSQNIAKKLRITPAAVSQRSKRIQALLDQEPDLNPFR